MFEVYTGTRPGRPRLLLVLSAVILAGVLGAAWLQVRHSRTLEPERRIEGTPLVVRLPEGWVQPNKNDPGLFVLPIQRTVHGKLQWEADREIRFRYERTGAFRAPLDMLAEQPSAEFEPTPAHIGPFEAVQMRQVLRRRWGRSTVVRQQIIRLTCLPGGEVISVTYVPMTDLTVADLRLFDKVCLATRVEDGRLVVPPQEAMEHAGVEFPVDDDAVTSLPQIADVPGMHLGGSENSVPVWSLGIFRTWLAAGRAPRDLLLDFAANKWLLSEEDAEVREWTRADGARVAAIAHPQPARNRSPISAVWVVAESPEEAVMLLAQADGRYAASAATAAEAVVEEIAITPLAAIPPIEAAEAAGAELAALLTKTGAKSWWGRRPLVLKYRGRTVEGSEMLVTVRRVPDGGSDLGYEGQERWQSKDKPWSESVYWRIDARAIGYERERVVYVADGVSLSIADNRQADSDVVDREIRVRDVRRWSGELRTGPAYICPPIESIAEARVARAEEGAWIIESTANTGRRTHTRLLRPLPAEDGHLRVLAQDDYEPVGAILAFDEDEEGHGDGELLYREEPTARLERVR